MKLESCNPYISKVIIFHNHNYTIIPSIFVPILVNEKISAFIAENTTWVSSLQAHFKALLRRLLGLPTMHIVKITQDDGIGNISELLNTDPNEIEIILNNINKAYN